MNYLIRWYNWKINLLEINSMQIESIINSIKTYDPNVNSDQILKAYEFSKKVHSKQIRASGVPYLEHPIQVAKLLTEIKLDGPSIVTGLLHDTVEDTETSILEIKNKFGNEITYLVDGLTKINQLSLKKILIVPLKILENCY